jgi:hypothetical protein
MLRVFYLYIAYVALAIHVCCKCMFQMFHLFKRILQLNVVYVAMGIYICCKCMFVISSVWDVCCSKCFILQVLHDAGSGRRQRWSPRTQRSPCAHGKRSRHDGPTCMRRRMRTAAAGGARPIGAAIAACRRAVGAGVRSDAASRR